MFVEQKKTADASSFARNVVLDLCVCRAEENDAQEVGYAPEVLDLCVCRAEENSEQNMSSIGEVLDLCVCRAEENSQRET